MVFFRQMKDSIVSFSAYPQFVSQPFSKTIVYFIFLLLYLEQCG